jgi:ABC-2 type transport system permease protein
MTILRRFLLDRRRSALWWTIGMVLTVASIVALWPSMKGQPDLEDITRDLPQGVQVLFGLDDAVGLTSAPGYLQSQLFAILPILLIIFAVGLGTRAIGGAEEDGTLQLVAVAPVTRRRLALERFAAAGALVVGLTAIGLAATLAVGAAVGIFESLSVSRVVVDTVAMAELALLHLAIAFAAGAATGRRGFAIATASAVAAGTYILHGLAASAAAIRPLRVVSPWWWFLDRNLLVHDPTFLAVVLPLLLSAGIVAYGVRAYERRDLRFP